MRKERPILFSAPMVRAILEDRKTQTRRIIQQNKNPHDFLGSIGDDKNDPYNWGFENPDCMGHFVTLPEQRCPYGSVGDGLWVRETFFANTSGIMADPVHERHVSYKATHQFTPPSRWIPSIHMPRWAARIDLLIKSVRVERLQDISEEDAIAEGVFCDYAGASEEFTHGYEFRELWSSINGASSWDTNPWVWVVEFERMRP